MRHPPSKSRKALILCKQWTSTSAASPPETQERLAFIRQTSAHVFPGAEEKLYHALPSLAMGGHVFLFYGAYQAHISICVGYDWVDFLKRQYPQFSYTMATILFPHKDPLPQDVIRVIFDLIKQSLDNTGQGHYSAPPAE
jgi:uncharacterized protein YdhG (YjbR/CyaY superfamily)